MASSDFNLEKLNTAELGSQLAASIQLGGNVAIFGRRGTGKTQIAKQEIAKAKFKVNGKEVHCKEVYMNLSVLERVDMGGYPNILAGSQGKKFVDFLLPQFYEAMLEGDQPVVALLDEVDKADPSLWAPLLEFTQFHSINGRHLPNLQAVIMTGNLISEGGSRPSLPLLDRAEKYLVEPDTQGWLNWAGREGKIHPSITAYIQDNQKDLFGSVDPEDRYSDPSPRGWHRASDILTDGEGVNLSSELLNKKVSGCIGKDVGLRYSHYYTYYQSLLPLIEEIFKGKDIKAKFRTLEPSKQLIGTMIACSRLCSLMDTEEMKSKKLADGIANVGKFFKYVPSENILIAVRSQITIDRLVKFNLDEHPEWEETINKINKQTGA